jgi:hypothetical protein
MLNLDTACYAAGGHTIGHTRERHENDTAPRAGITAAIAHGEALNFAGKPRTPRNSSYISALQHSHDVPRLAWAGTVLG